MGMKIWANEIAEKVVFSVIGDTYVKFPIYAGNI